MQGFEDPFNRRTYPWGKEDKETLMFYHTLCAVRAGSGALCHGSLRFLQTDDGLLVYERETPEEWVVIATNRGSEAREIVLPCPCVRDLVGGGCFEAADDSGTHILLDAEQAMILDCGKRADYGFYGEDADAAL